MSIQDTALPTPVDPFNNSYQLYVNAGWDTPFPLPANQKFPPPTGYTGRGALIPSGADLYTWGDTLNQNIGLHLPITIIGLDVDHYGVKTGGYTLDAAINQYGPLPKTYVSTARTDGTSGIRYYTIPTGTELESPGTDIDMIQNSHRYSVVWPSVHPDTNTMYQWIDGTTGQVMDGPPNIADIPPLPQTWIDGLKREAREARAKLTGQAKDILNAYPEGAPCHHLSDVNDRWSDKVRATSSAHDAASSLVWYLCKQGRSGCPGARAALARVRDLFFLEVGGRRDPDDMNQEWYRLLEGAAEESGAIQGDSCPDDPTSLLPPQVAPDIKVDNPTLLTDTPTRSSWAPIDLTAILSGNNPEPKPDYLQRTDNEAMFYRNKVNSLIGESESGKTWVALLAVAQALNNGDKVAFIDFEDSPTSLIGRIKRLGTTINPDRLNYMNPDEGLGQPMPAEDFKAILNNNYDLIVLDGVNGCMSLLGLSLNDNDDANKFDQQILKPLAKSGACVVLIDHLPKSNGNGQATSPGAIGAQAKRSAITGASIRVVADKDGKPRPGHKGILTLTIDKDRPGHVRGVGTATGEIGVCQIDSTNDTTTVITIDPIWDGNEERNAIEELIGAMDKAGIPAATGRDKAREALTAAGHENMPRNEIVSDAIRVRKRRARYASDKPTPVKELVCKDCGKIIEAGRVRCPQCKKDM